MAASASTARLTPFALGRARLFFAECGFFKLGLPIPLLRRASHLEVYSRAGLHARKQSQEHWRWLNLIYLLAVLL